MKINRLGRYLLMGGLLCLSGWYFIPTASAQIKIEVTTILASQETQGSVDPEVIPFVKELRSVFRYDSYRSLGTDRMELELNQTGTAGLPGDRVLKVTPLKISGDRLEMSLEIYKKNNQIFDTLVKLRNRSNIIVGGPQHQGGYLLFRLYNKF